MSSSGEDRKYYQCCWAHHVDQLCRSIMISANLLLIFIIIITFDEYEYEDIAAVSLLFVS